MEISYDPEADALYVRLAEGKILDSDQIAPGVVLDYDESDNIVGVEVLHLTKRRKDELPGISIVARMREATE